MKGRERIDKTEQPFSCLGPTGQSPCRAAPDTSVPKLRRHVLRTPHSGAISCDTDHCPHHEDLQTRSQILLHPIWTNTFGSLMDYSKTQPKKTLKILYNFD